MSSWQSYKKIFDSPSACPSPCSPGGDGKITQGNAVKVWREQDMSVSLRRVPSSVGREGDGLGGVVLYCDMLLVLEWRQASLSLGAGEGSGLAPAQHSAPPTCNGQALCGPALLRGQNRVDLGFTHQHHCCEWRKRGLATLEPWAACLQAWAQAQPFSATCCPGPGAPGSGSRAVCAAVPRALPASGSWRAARAQGPKEGTCYPYPGDKSEAVFFGGPSVAGCVQHPCTMKAAGGF